MNEILPGIWHWATPRASIGGKPVSSYWIDEGGVAIDPLVPEDAGLDWFAARPTPPSAVVLSCRHHYRDSGDFNDRFGCTIQAPRSGMQEFTSGEPVTAYDPGDVLPGGLVAVEVGVLSPDDSALYLPDRKVLWLADAAVRSMTDPASKLGWVIDVLMDDPPETKRRLLERLSEILDEYDFEHLMLGHGLPLVGDGRAQLEELVRSGGRTAVEAFE